MGIRPTRDQLNAFLEAPIDGPVVMINLLKFKERAEGEDGSGEEAYGRYGASVVKMVEERGGRVVWAGRPHGVLIGGDADEWDQVVLVEYPSRDAFIEMTSNPDYEDVHTHREAGLERTVLTPCRAAIDISQER